MANLAIEPVTYETDTGQEITLDARTILDVCLNGNGQITNKEAFVFAELCKALRLNPFTKEAYLVKYGNQAAQIITGKDVFTKRAARNENCEGYTAGVCVLNAQGRYEEHEGSMVRPGETLLGGWAEVYMKGNRKPLKDTVALAEYSTGKSTWQKMPGTMIRKVALVHALREAMPEELGGLYDSTEMDQAVYGTAPIQQPEPTFEVVPEPPKPAPTVQQQAPAISAELQAAQKRVGEAMRIAKADGLAMAGFHQYAQSYFGKPIKQLNAAELSELADYVEQSTELHESELMREFEEVAESETEEVAANV